MTNKNAGKSLGEACEDLRLASLVLKQTHDEETACANENAKRDAKLADAVKREHDALRAFRSETNAAAETVARSMAELKDNLDRAAVAAARQAKEAREAQASVLAASVLAAENKNRAPESDVPAVPRIERVHVAAATSAAVSLADSPDASATSARKRRADDERASSTASPTASPASPPRTKEREVIVRTENDPRSSRSSATRARAEAAAEELTRARLKLSEEREVLTEELRDLRARHARESAEASRLAADAEKWRAMYDAAKRDAARATRRGTSSRLCATRRARRTRNTRARLRRSAPNTAPSTPTRGARSRRRTDASPTSSPRWRLRIFARVRWRSRRARRRERRRDVEEELARARGDLQRRGRDASLAHDETAAELESVSEQLERVKRRAADERESLERALETARSAAAAAALGDDAAAGATTSWRVASLENELRKASESASAEREETGVCAASSSASPSSSVWRARPPRRRRALGPSRASWRRSRRSSGAQRGRTPPSGNTETSSPPSRPRASRTCTGPS